jgi:hypothetical protein
MAQDNLFSEIATLCTLLHLLHLLHVYCILNVTLSVVDRWFETQFVKTKQLVFAAYLQKHA